MGIDDLPQLLKLVLLSAAAFLVALAVAAAAAMAGNTILDLLKKISASSCLLVSVLTLLLGSSIARCAVSCMVPLTVSCGG